MPSWSRVHKQCAIIALLSLALTGCGGGSGSNSRAVQWKAGDVPIGQWGADKVINLQVTSSGGNLDGGCVLGTMTSAPVLDAAGAFDAVGTYRTLHTLPGAAHFIGTVQGATMTVTITVPDDGTPFTVGPFRLTLGKHNTDGLGTCP